MTEQPDLPMHTFDSQRHLEEWLEAEHDTSAGIWVKIAKVKSGIRSVTYPELVESGLCFGWIDGLRKSLDDDFYVQRFTPRRPRSVWSMKNRKSVEELIEAGRMRPSGMAAVEAARADGRWERAYGSQRTMEVPPDLQARLDANPRAQAFFETLSGSNRFAILYRIHDAKRPETRARRIDTFVQMLESGTTIY